MVTFDFPHLGCPPTLFVKCTDHSDINLTFVFTMRYILKEIQCVKLNLSNFRSLLVSSKYSINVRYSLDYKENISGAIIKVYLGVFVTIWFENLHSVLPEYSVKHIFKVSYNKFGGLGKSGGVGGRQCRRGIVFSSCYVICPNLL